MMKSWSFWDKLEKDQFQKSLEDGLYYLRMEDLSVKIFRKFLGGCGLRKVIGKVRTQGIEIFNGVFIVL